MIENDRIEWDGMKRREEKRREEKRCYTM